jgi:hypothetical protein
VEDLISEGAKMYTLILIVAVAAPALVAYWGFKRGSRVIGFLGAALMAVAIGVFAVMSIYGEMLWFEALGLEDRFWTEFLTKALVGLVSALAGVGVVLLLSMGISGQAKIIRWLGAALIAVIAFLWGINNWDAALLFINGTASGVSDPIIGKDASFYLFSLPFYRSVQRLLLTVSLISLIVCAISLSPGLLASMLPPEQRDKVIGNSSGDPKSLIRSAAVLLVVLAAGFYLDRFELMYSTSGVVTGPGWTDVNIRIGAYWVLIVVSLVVAALVFFRFMESRSAKYFEKLVDSGQVPGQLALPAAAGIVVIVVWYVALSFVPGMFQWLYVEPNEITFEKPYISNNIKYTRLGFGLHDVEAKEFPVAQKFTEKMAGRNEDLFSNIRLWDHRALDAVYKQFQEIRLYYEFVDVDIDRYHIGSDYRQVMVSARELELSNLPEKSQTFVNKRFKYTHGYGITLNTVHDFTPQGLPNLLIKDIPPKSEYESLKITRPQIYYGELTDSYVVANSSEREFDYPRGAGNKFIKYPGNGGVQLTNFWRKFLFGWKFDGARFLFSGYPTPQSRIMFHRDIRDRAKTIAPFLRFDRDPYIVLSNGKLYWLMDAYTVSSYYPYSKPFYAFGPPTSANPTGARGATDLPPELNGVNYVRNSIKVVIDAFEGTVDMYVFEPDDPIIKTWRKIFPDLFKDRDQMPEGLLKHIRYPVDLLLCQGEMYAKYHMRNPEVFYNQEDLWVRATEKYYANVQPVQPYYIMWEPPGKDEPEFTLIMPFTPKNRQVMIGWIAGMCDPGNYGRFLAYKFPKEKRILGPQQVETKIDQDRHLSGQLTLWDQRGSRVIRGNVLAIPVEETIIYVEPIYLQAETAAYPELRLVAVMHNDKLSYAESFDKALKGLFQEIEPEAARMETPGTKDNTVSELIKKARNSFDRFISYFGERNFSRAGEELNNLGDYLKNLHDRTTGPETDNENR